MGLKRILSRRKSKSDPNYEQVRLHDSHSTPIINHLENIGLNVKDSIVASYAMMSTTIAEHFSDEEDEDIENRGMYHKNATYESAFIHPVKCKRDIYVERVTRDSSKKGKKTIKGSIYQQNNTPPKSKDNSKTFTVQSREGTHVKYEIDQIPCDDEIDFTMNENVNPLRIKTIGVQPGHLRVETSETKSANIGNFTPDQFYVAQMHPTHAMVKGTVFRPVSMNPLHSEISPSSTVSSVTIPVELDNHTPKDRFYNIMKSPQQMVVMGAIDEDADAEMAEL